MIPRRPDPPGLAAIRSGEGVHRDPGQAEFLQVHFLATRAKEDWQRSR